MVAHTFNPRSQTQVNLLIQARTVTQRNPILQNKTTQHKQKGSGSKHQSYSSVSGITQLFPYRCVSTCKNENGGHSLLLHCILGLLVSYRNGGVFVISSWEARFICLQTVLSSISCKSLWENATINVDTKLKRIVDVCILNDNIIMFTDI